MGLTMTLGRDGVLEQARALANARSYTEARAQILGHLERAPSDVSAWLLLADIAFAQQDLTAQLEALSHAAALAPASAQVLYAQGRLHKQRGELPGAIDCYQRAAAADPTSADIRTSLGVALRAIGRADEAIALYREALSLAPGHIAANRNLANALEAHGEFAEAQACRATAQQGLIAHIAMLHDRVLELQREGRDARALGIANEALQIVPSWARVVECAAIAARDRGQFELALEHYDRAIELEPHHLPAIESARRIAVTAGLVTRARRYGEIEMRLSDAADCRIALRLMLPAIPESAEAVAAARLDYGRALDELLEQEVSLGEPLAVLGNLSYFLAYHGRNDRELQIKAAKLCLKAVPWLNYTAPHCLGRKRRTGRIRVGLISRFLYWHSIGKTTRGLIDQLDRARFEITVIRVGPAPEDDLTAAMRARADRFVALDSARGVEDAQRTLAQLELDILFYQDIGMEPFTYFLSFARLAPVQCVSFGHPNTTGVPTMDYFISNDLYETPESSNHYSETLFLLHDLPTLAYYYRPPASSELPDRVALGLPERGTLYVCPQQLFKLHPEFDAILAAILAADPSGYLVLIRGQYQERATRLAERLRRAIPAQADRVIFLPTLSAEHFMRLLSIADVMLDPPHFNGMNSSLEAFSVGLPVVTLPGTFQRQRHTRAMYVKMDVHDCMAATAQEYIEIAVGLGTDREWRQGVSARILERSGTLYENMQVVREFERFFAEALESPALTPPS